MVKRWTASQQTDWPFWFGFFFSKSIQYVRKKNQFQWIVWRLSIESIIEFRNRIHKRQWKMKILTPTHPHWSQSNVCNEEWYRIDVSNHHSLMDGSLIITCDLDSNKKKKKISKINGWNKIEKSNNKITPKKKKKITIQILLNLILDSAIFIAFSLCPSHDSEKKPLWIINFFTSEKPKRFDSTS